MKLLLTSAGITNKEIAEGLASLLDKPVSQAKIGYVPTAANVEVGNQGWHINQFNNLQKFGYNWIDIIDPSAADVNWQKRLEAVDIVLVGGGNTFHLLNQARQTGFDKWLNENNENKVYVGISAGSIIATPTIAIAPVDGGDVNYCGIKDLTGLGWVDFEVSPHSPEDVSYGANEAYAKTTPNKLYAIDDETAIKVDGNKVEIISEGKYKIFNQQVLRVEKDE